MSAAVRILVADDHEMVRRGICSLLRERKDWEVCGEVTNGRDAVERAIELRPNVVVMDVTMPLLGGLEATRRIRKALPDCEVLILTMHESEQLIRELLAAGAHGYLLKTDAGQLVADAVESLAAHRPFFTSRVSQVLLNNFLGQGGTVGPEPAEGATLTSREAEVVQ
jgi:DNA-binding NarL/FixJ family response regulator